MNASYPDASPTAVDTGLARVSVLPNISLDDLDDLAALQQRVDRKYIVDGAVVTDVIDHLAHRLAALEIDGRRTFGYESTYFDTPDLRSFHATAHRRRRRFKVRTRTYLDAGTAMLEVKTRGARGETIKTRRPHDLDARTVLDGESVAFVDSVLASPGLGRELRPTLTTGYRRTTLIDLDDIGRVTIDADLRCVDRQHRSTGLVARYVLETKSTGGPGATDRRLWQMGVRPDKISKYGTGLAALDPSLPSNRWHLTLQRNFR